MAVIVVRELEKVVKATSLALYNSDSAIKFIAGDGNLIIAMLRSMPADLVTPYVILEQPFDEFTGEAYLRTSLRRIIVATPTDSTNPVLARYDETFEPVLYKIYEELFKQIAKYKGILQDNHKKLVSRKNDVPGTVPVMADSKKYWDTIELYDLQLDFKEAGRIC